MQPMSIGTEPEEPDLDGIPHARNLYWRALVQLKVDCEYIQRYRNQVASDLSRYAVARAIVSAGALGSWFAGLGQAKIWGGIITTASPAWLSTAADSVARV